jgi:hypothetical protein
VGKTGGGADEIKQSQQAANEIQGAIYGTIAKDQNNNEQTNINVAVTDSPQLAESPPPQLVEPEQNQQGEQIEAPEEKEEP